MKKIIALVLTLVLCLSVTAFAEPVFEDMNVTVELDGNVLEFDKKPLVESGRTLVPLRAISDAMGVDVMWDDATSTAKLFSK